MKAFISYNTRDYDMASLLRDELNKKSIECWMAPESIPGGDNYAQRIPWAIRNSDVFIVLVSAHSMESYWVQNEIGYAVKCRKTLVPIHLDRAALTDTFTFMLLSCQLIETGGRILEALPEILKALSAAVNENNTKTQPKTGTRRIRPADSPGGKEREKNTDSPDGKEKEKDAKADQRRRLEEMVLEAERCYDRRLYDQAFILFSQAANAGSPEAQLHMGKCLQRGRGTAPDLTKGASWILKAAEQGLQQAQMYAGFLYLKGMGVPVDPNIADKFFEQADRTGSAETELQIGHLCHSAGHYQREKHWYEKAAERDCADAYYFLGILYQNGQGVERDLKKAIDQFLRASERGSAGADERIGWFFHKGYVMARSDADALVWFRRAASHNHKLGEYDMGLCYEYGWGVERNLKEAANWYERSFHHGYRKAGEALRRISRQ